MNGLVVGGRIAAHIMMVRTAPLAAAGRMAMPRISAVPMASSAAMNRKSAAAVPAMDVKKPLNGPLDELRKPCVGLPALSQDLAEVVEKPRPNVLSRNAQRKIQP